MFLGFPILRGLSIMPLESIEFNQLVANLFATPEVDLEGSRLLDTYPFDVEGVKYEQKVYRLKDGSLYKETKQLTDVGGEYKKALQTQLEEAVANQEFEKAVELRDKIKKLA